MKWRNKNKWIELEMHWLKSDLASVYEKIKRKLVSNEILDGSNTVKSREKKGGKSKSKWNGYRREMQ